MLNNNLKNFEAKVIFVILLANILLSIGVFFISYRLFENAMIQDLNNRSDSVYKHALDKIDLNSFYFLNNSNDEQSVLYQKMLTDFNNLRESANIKYLYTAKKNNLGDYIYLIDGYEKGADDFRHIGDHIEPEILEQIKTTITYGKVIYGNKIQDTEWGSVYIVFYPVFDGNNVIGAIGLEFDRTLMSIARKKTIRISFILCSFLLIISVFTTISLMRKISYPFLRKLAYNDLLTGVQNRNAFELYLKKLSRKSSPSINSIFFIEFDLNNLKKVNDNYGHETGDLYLKHMANLLKNHLGHCQIFRVGGDEFAVIGTFASLEQLNSSLEKMYAASLEQLPSHNCSIKFEYAYGFAIYNPAVDDIVKKVDKLMYEMKQSMKSRINI